MKTIMLNNQHPFSPKSSDLGNFSKCVHLQLLPSTTCRKGVAIPRPTDLPSIPPSPPPPTTKTQVINAPSFRRSWLIGCTKLVTLRVVACIYIELSKSILS
ncbi:hypothetical protein Csa_022609 [Cucumis sativus]|uniref:Uncharacterized protein n=1 Tax=Cucumis sativus TaxID=3659 RepID=A0A0A0LRR9_CUCSA|nr:hypothetical protein Csa_022609 [Cucumis sativus]